MLRARLSCLWYRRASLERPDRFSEELVLNHAAVAAGCCLGLEPEQAVSELPSSRRSPTAHQQLPASGPEREALRKKGQFWTPDWVAEGMVGYALAGGSRTLFDPAVGGGAFFQAAHRVAAELGRAIRLRGAEVYPEVLQEARAGGLSDADLAGVEIRDFLLNPPAGPLQSIVANPPYIRHHRLPREVKDFLKGFSTRLLGNALDGRAGLHVYFLLRALELLGENGRLAFIMPADTCEGVFAPALWRWIARNYRLDGVITFAPEASPFPRVDTNAVIFLVQKAEPAATVKWALCSARTDELKKWCQSDLTSAPGEGLHVFSRSLAEAIQTGLSRAPANGEDATIPLRRFARVMRGIATGANEFFFLSPLQAEELGIPPRFLRPAIGRTRDVEGNVVTSGSLESLEKAGRPCLLLSLDGRAPDAFPGAVQKYLTKGEELGLPKRALIAMRRPWYKMETREPPPFLFAYLGRRSARFIRNEAGVVPLTGFLCVYPAREDRAFTDKLWKLLTHPDVIKNLRLVAKSYGGGAIKVEPRALETLPIPRSLVEEVGLPVEDEAEQLACL